MLPGVALLSGAVREGSCAAGLMREWRVWYRPGPREGFSPPQAVRHACCRRSRPSVNLRKIRCVGAIRRPARGVSPPVDQRSGRVVDMQHRGAVQAHTDRRRRWQVPRVHRDHPRAVTSRAGDHAATSTAA
jgi:hypothetical protein